MSVVSILFAILLGGIALYIFRKMAVDNNTVATWSKTQGTILKTEVMRGRGPKLLVTYAYHVDGIRYESKNVFRNNPYYGLSTSTDLKKLEFLNNPEVKYDPKNPADSCLLFYKAWYFVIVLLAGIILSLIGWIGLLVKIINDLL